MLFGLFARAPRALRVVETSGGAMAVPANERVHAEQRVQRTWRIASDADDDATAVGSSLGKLSLQCPGLAVVRVNPELQQHNIAAVVRVTSDAALYADAVRVVLKRRRRELRVCFKNRRYHKDMGVLVGSLVVEIELARGHTIDELFAKAGGDVVVERGVLARCSRAGDGACDARTCGVGVIAFDQSRLFVDETASDDADEPIADGFCELGVGSLHGGRVYLSASHLRVRELLGSSVMGSGSVHIHAERVTTKHIKIGAIGDAGSATLSVTDALHADALEAFVWGGAVVAVDATRGGGGVACETLALQVEGRGAIDASDVLATLSSDVRIRGNGRIALQAPSADAELSLDCDACATVTCLGASSLSVSSTAIQDAACRVLFAANKSRVSAARPCPPSVASAFERPTEIRAQRAGFRERHLRPLLGFH